MGLAVEHAEGPEEDGRIEADDLLRLRGEAAVLLEEDLEIAAVLEDQVGLAVAVEIPGFDAVGPRPGLEHQGFVLGVLQGQERREGKNHDLPMLMQ